MLIFSAKLGTRDVEQYMATVVLPGYFQGLKLDPVRFDIQTRGTSTPQPLRVSYSMPGHVEDFALDPVEHAIPLLKSALPGLNTERVRLFPESKIWSFTDSAMTILFTVADFSPETWVEKFAPNDAYVSVTRRQVYLSCEVFQRFIERVHGHLGLELPADAVVEWDYSVGGMSYRADPVSIQIALSDESILSDILAFAALTGVLNRLNSWVELCFQEIQDSYVQSKHTGITIPLRDMV